MKTTGGKYKSELNPGNLLGCGGTIAKQWAGLLEDLYNPDSMSHVNPSKFRRAVGRQRQEFAGFEQHDSQEFVMFLLDALSEDLSRIGKKPYTTIPDSTDEMVHDQQALEEFGKTCWELYESRNASVITDLFSGMYKSTLVCPDCHKTSFIMDPFSTLTLPIPPGAQPMSRTITFVPLDGPPVLLKVQLDANETLRTWKNFVGEKFGVDGDRLFAAEVYHHCFWTIFDEGDDESFESLDTKENDNITFFDLGPVSGSSKDDSIIVSVFHRTAGTRKNKMNNHNSFGLPSFIRVSRKEAGDYEAIYRKLLALGANMTTRDILSAEDAAVDEHATDDSDTVVTNEDDAQSADSRVKTTSVDGEDSIVDISMPDAQTPKPAEDTEMSDSDSDSESIKAPQHPLAGKLPARLLSLFDVTVMRSPKNDLPDGRGMSTSKDFPLLSSRIPSTGRSSKVHLTSLY
jgi:ubiquitin carboxyl-terminal hydrolase 4/11/15